MCIRDRAVAVLVAAMSVSALLGVTIERLAYRPVRTAPRLTCLLYTSDAADERSSVDLGGRRYIKKKTNRTQLR